MFLVYCDGKRYKTYVLFIHCYGKRYKSMVCVLLRCKRYKSNAFLMIAMANAIKPLLCVDDCDGKRFKTNVFLIVAMAYIIKSMFVLLIAMADIITPLCACFYCDGKGYKTNVLLLIVVIANVIFLLLHISIHIPFVSCSKFS